MKKKPKKIVHKNKNEKRELNQNNSGTRLDIKNTRRIHKKHFIHLLMMH